MIDTGSVGLRVLAATDPGAMSNSASTNPPTESRYRYGSGVSLNGVDIQDDITVGRSGHIAFQSGDAQPVFALMAFDTGAPGVVIHSADIDTPSIVARRHDGHARLREHCIAKNRVRIGPARGRDLRGMAPARRA